MKEKKAIRLMAKIDQLVVDLESNRKPIITIIDRVPLHQDGVMTGTAKVQGQTFHAKYSVYHRYWVYDHRQPTECKRIR